MEVQGVSSRDSRLINSMENELTEPVSMYADSQEALRAIESFTINSDAVGGVEQLWEI